MIKEEIEAIIELSGLLLGLICFGIFACMLVLV